jgi:hypothetical protein
MNNVLEEPHSGAFDPTTMSPVEDQAAIGFTRLPEIAENSKPQRMKPMRSLGRISLLDGGAIALAQSRCRLNIVGVHQDAVTGEWAKQVANNAIQLVREFSVHSTWWKIGGLSDPGVLRDAAQAATTADVLIVSIRAAAALPFALYQWVKAWLPRRLPLTGTLAVLIGAPEPLGADSFRIGRYLQAVARRGQLAFLVREQRLPLEPPDFSIEEIAEQTSARTQAFSGMVGYPHWGLNE